MSAAPSAWTLQHVVSLAQSTIDRLRSEDGLVLDSETEILTALAEEQVDVVGLLRRLALARLNAKTLGAAQDQRLADLKTRRERSKRAEEAYRATVAAVMEAILPADAAGVRRFADPEFSLTLVPGKAGVKLVDESKLPAQFVELTVLRAPDKAAIKAALEARQLVPGAVLSNGHAVLTMRTR